MSISDNKDLFRRFYERAWNNGDPSVVDELLAAGFVNHALPLSGSSTTRSGCSGS